MVLRDKPAGRRHLARLAAVSLISLSLVGLSGAANADKPGDRTPASSPSDPSLCLPDSPVKVPVDLNACLKTDDHGLPAVEPSDPSPDQDTQADPEPSTDPDPLPDPSSGPSLDPGSLGKYRCISLPAHLREQLPADLLAKLPPTCIPKCLSDSVIRLLKKLPEATLDELLAEITRTLGELPDCLLSVLPKSPSTPPTSEPPLPSPKEPHIPPVHHHVPWHAGPAVPVDGSPSFTG